MGFDTINQNKRVGLGVGAALILFAVGILAFQLHGGSGSAASAPSRAFYTDDNGKTFFKDDLKAVPFDHNGKQAYRCYVFESSDGKQFVGLIYRYTDTGRAQMQEYFKTQSKDTNGSTRRGIEERAMQVKLITAGEKAWDYNDEATNGRLVSSVRDASGKPAKLVQP